MQTNTDKKIVLYYKGYCGKCRYLSKLVVRLSFGTITRVPLEYDEGITFFYEEHPKADGYPILFINKKAFYGVWVFICVPVAIVVSWFYRIKNLFSINTQTQ